MSTLRLLSLLTATSRAVAPTFGVAETDALAESGGVVTAGEGDEDGAPQLAMHAVVSSTSR